MFGKKDVLTKNGYSTQVPQVEYHLGQVIYTYLLAQYLGMKQIQHLQGIIPT